MRARKHAPRPGTGCTAAALLLLAGGSAAADIDLYGKLNVTLQRSDEAAGSTVELQSNASRIGVKGDEQLRHGLTAIYQLEWEVDPEGESGSDIFSPRNQFVGLEGAFGTLKVGRHDTALKAAQGDFDLFNDLEGDIKHTFNGENRLADYIGYTTPAFAEAFSVTVNLFPGEDAAAGNDGIADGTSVAATYDAEPLYLSLARDSDLDGEGVETTRLAGAWARGDLQVALLYQRTDAGNVDADGFGVSLAWTAGSNTAEVQYLDGDFWRIDPQADPLDNRLESQVSLGIDHELGPATTLFAFYTSGDIGGTGEGNGYLGVGLEHEF